jgi:CDP-diacylglycerol--glycerol-3-phosphate 3-phosphatidyltransferase
VNTAITLAAILLCVTVISAYAARVMRVGRARHARLGPSPGSAFLPGWLVEAFYWAMHAPARLLIWSGATPDMLTYASFFLCLASLPLAALGHFAAAAAVIVVGAILDAMDGMVARARGIASQAGAVLDSFVDRASDAAPFIGLALFYRHHALTLLVPLVALVASSLVRYARAKADQHALSLPNGVMRRHERVVYLSVSLLVAPLVPSSPVLGGVRYPLTLLGVALVAVGSTVASILLVARTRAALRAREAPPAPRVIPQGIHGLRASSKS